MDWFGLASNGLWILGLAVALAAISYADWRRSLGPQRQTLRQALAQPAFQTAWSLGMLLFCSGLALAGGAWWQTAAWAGLALAFLYLGGSAALRTWRARS